MNNFFSSIILFRKEIHILVDLLNGRASSRATASTSTSGHTTSRHTSWHSTWHTLSFLIQLSNDGIADSFHFFLLVSEFVLLGQLVTVQPTKSIIALADDTLPFILRNLVLQLLVIKSRLHVETIRFKPVLRRNTFLLLFILSFELLCIIDHLLNVFLRQSTLVISDSDLILLSSRLISRRNVQDAICVDVKGDLNLRHSPGSGRYSSQIELAQVMIILGHSSFTFENLDGDCRLIISVGGESLSLFGGNSSVPLDKRCHYTSSRFDSERKRSNVKQQKIRDGFRGVPNENCCLNSSTVCNSFIRIDRFVQLFSVEEVLKKFLDFGNPGGTTNKDDVVDRGFIHLGVSHSLFYRLKGSFEEIRTQFFEPSSGDGCVEIDPFEQGIDFDVCLSRSRKSPLSSLTSGPQSSQSSLVPAEIFLVFSLEFIDKMIHHPVVKVLSSKMRISSSRLHLEDSVIDAQNRNIKSSTSKIEDQDVTLTRSFLLVQSVSNSSSSGFIDDPENIQASNDPSIFSGLSLAVIEVSRNSNYSFRYSRAKIGFSSVFHLDQNHGTNLFGGKSFFLILILNLQLGQPVGVDHCEGPVLFILLNRAIIIFPSNQPLGVKDGIGRVDGNLVLSSITDKSFGVCESHVGRRGSIALIIGNDFYFAMLEGSHARIGGTQVDSHSVSLGHDGVLFRNMFPSWSRANM